MLHKLLVALVVGSMSVAATECGSEAQVLFQSNAYADAIKEDNNYQGSYHHKEDNYFYHLETIRNYIKAWWYY